MKEKFEKIKTYENQLLQTINTPYVLLTMSLDQTHLNLFTSPELDSIINKDEILNDYIIPLLASKDKNKLFSKVSAALLNGYAQIGDEIAASQNIKLESSIGSGGKTFGTIWKVFMYFIVVTGLVAYTIAVLKSKKK
jgi:ABC-type antimicrobial peptide transport system permease subunit